MSPIHAKYRDCLQLHLSPENLQKKIKFEINKFISLTNMKESGKRKQIIFYRSKQSL